MFGVAAGGEPAPVVSPRARMRTQKYKATTRSARCWLVQSLRDCSKWVRAKVSKSPQKETSRSERAEVVRAAGTGEEESGKKPRRCATNWQGEEKEKHAVLSLFSI